jgi:hypothetical protein
VARTAEDGSMTISIADAIRAASRARRSRFQVAPKDQRTLDGVVFDSKKEASRYAELKLLEKQGLITDLKLQPKFPVEINGKPYCSYSADFSFYDRQLGRAVVEDVKSTGSQKDAAFRLRKKAAELCHGIKVVEVIR